MAKKLTTLANPVRSVEIRGRTFKWKPLTLYNLAQLEADYGSLQDFFTRATEGHIEPVLRILTIACQNADPSTDEEHIGSAILAGDLQQDGIVTNWLIDILQESGLQTSEKKEHTKNQTGD